VAEPTYIGLIQDEDLLLTKHGFINLEDRASANR
jgi:hypothetical protein